MAILEKALARLGYTKAAPARRAFTGAKSSNLTWSWVTQPTHVNADLQQGLRALRARSRDLEQNNDYARKFLSMVETNVVGHAGFSLFIEPKRPDGSIDRPDAQRLEAAFWRWADQCEVTGLSFTEVQRLFIRTVARDGEVIVRQVRGGPFGFRLQLIDPQRVDELYNEDLAGGRKVRLGVEYDEAGAVVAYHLSTIDTADPRQPASPTARRLRVPADECRLYFPRQSIGQLRGVPMMSSALLRMQMLGGYEEAAVVAARVGAAKMGAITTEDGDISAMGDAQQDGTNVVDAAEPGGFFNLPPGSKLESWDPDYPHQQYGDFVRACLRGISSGLGVSYATLANDLENVNYSSIRAGVLEEREVWKALQGWMIDVFLRPLYSDWLRFALVSGALDPLPASRFEKFNAARWQGRRWDWVDPERDMNANILAIKHGLKSRHEIVAEQGRDLSDVWADLAQEQQDAAAQSIVLADLVVAPTAPPPAPPPAEPQREPAREAPSVTVNTIEHPETLSRVADVFASSVTPSVNAMGESVNAMGESVKTLARELAGEMRDLRKDLAAIAIEQGQQTRAMVGAVKDEMARPKTKSVQIPRPGGKPLLAIVREE